MNITGINHASHSETPEVRKAAVPNAGTIRIDNPLLHSIIGDKLELSPEAKKVASAFADMDNVYEILRDSDSALKMFGQDYLRRRNLILDASASNEEYREHKDKLLAALDSEVNKVISKFADDATALLDTIADQVKANDQKIVQSGWISGYRGATGLSLSESETLQFKSDIKALFSAVMRQVSSPQGASGVAAQAEQAAQAAQAGAAAHHSSNSAGSNAAAGLASAPASDEKSQPFSFRGNLITSDDFSGASLYHKLKDFQWSIRDKINTQGAMRRNQLSYSVPPMQNSAPGTQLGNSHLQNLNHRAAQQLQNSITDLQKTQALDGFSGNLRSLLGRFDAAASLHA